MEHPIKSKTGSLWWKASAVYCVALFFCIQRNSNTQFTTDFTANSLINCFLVESTKREVQNQPWLWENWIFNKTRCAWCDHTERDTAKEKIPAVYRRNEGERLSNKEEGHCHNWGHSTWDTFRSRCYVPSFTEPLALWVAIDKTVWS